MLTCARSRGIAGSAPRRSAVPPGCPRLKRGAAAVAPNGRPRWGDVAPKGRDPGVPREIRDVSCTAVPGPAGLLPVGSSAFAGMAAPEALIAS